MVHTYHDTLAWKQALGVEVLCYWAVPIFFMLSGVTLMGYRDKYSTKEFFKKRFMRTVIPFIAWSFINVLFKRINPLEIGGRTFINWFLQSKIENVYWFFIPLFAIYLSIPVLSLLKDNRKILWYMAGAAFILNSLLPSVFKSIGLSWNSALSMQTMGGYLLFSVLGYLLSTMELSKKQRGILYLLGLFSAALRYFATLFLSQRDGVINKMFFGYINYYSVLLGVAVFVFFKYLPLCKKMTQNQKVTRALKTLSSLSFGVYLIHMIIYRILDDFILPNSWEWRILVPFLIYALSLVIIYIMKKIPVIKYIVP